MKKIKIEDFHSARRFLLIILSLLFTQIILAQNLTVDSLNNLIKDAKTDAERVILYDKLSLAYFNQGNNDDAISAATIAYNKGNTLSSAEVLTKAYAKRNNFTKAYQYLLIYKQRNDSIFNDSINRRISLVENKLNLENESTIIQLKQNLKYVVQQGELKRKRILQIYAIGGICIFIVFISILLLFTSRVKRKSKKRMNEQKEKINAQQIEIEQIRKELNQKYEDIIIINAELFTQKKEIEEKNIELETQNEEISMQRDMLSAQNKSINESINYAKRIQNAVLPSQAYIDEILPENFILFMPRDSVSGDFYWARQINQFVVVSVADCTGHGVPGAIMSMLGISYLNEIVQKREITQANQVLNALRRQIKYALKQTGKEGDIVDGMDIALCVYDTKTKLLQYAGANNSILIVQNGNPVEIHADKMPIGFYPGEKLSFTNHEILLNEGDIFYLFSDGFIDQQGGPNGSKYKSSKFHDFLFLNHSKPMQILKKMIEQEFHDWMKGYQQTDDVLIMGVRV